MCTSPIDGWRSKGLSVRGKRSVVFDIKQGFHDRPVTVPCGRCMECRLKKKREWALRCLHESSLHEENSWLTLTYDDEHMPSRWQLRKSDLSEFIKRLRSREAYDATKAGRRERRFKFFGCGEYGGKFDRPHYHLLLFGYHFRDSEFFTVQNGFRVFKSELCDEVWSRGICDLGEVTFDGMAYLAKYVTKRDRKEEEALKSCGYEPEFLLMSRGGRYSRGIGYEWWKQYGEEALANDSVILKGREVAQPRYYDELNEVQEPEKVAKVKARRKARCDEDAMRTQRLLSREKIVESCVKLFER